MSDNNWDVIIIGAGSSGIPAAIFAAQRGARVLQVEADNRIGGTLHWSSGQMAAAGTSVQAKLGIEDSPQAHYDDVQRITGNTMDPILGKLAIDNAADTIEWLFELGFELAPGSPEAGVVHEPYTVRRYYWGTNEGISVLDALRPSYEKLVAENKITLKMGTKMTSLIVENDEVTGIRATRDGESSDYHGKNVVLTSGGYAANNALWQEFNPDQPLCSFCNPYSRGDGLVAAREHGAKVDGEEKFLCTFAGWREDTDDPLSGQFYNLAPNQRRAWEIYVNTKGERFMREDHPSIDYHENSLLEQVEMKMFIVCDSGILQNAPPITYLPEDEFKAKFGTHNNFYKADTITELADQTGMNADALKKTIEQYNQSVRTGKDTAFGREFMLREIKDGPYYAMGAQGITVCSPAGIAADAQLRVLREDGSVIENLYAAGEVLGFTRLTGKGFAGGMSLTPALTLGRLLGQKLLSW